MKTMIKVMALSSVVMALAMPARAEQCGNVSEAGVCQDPKTLLYCQDGELETMVCGPDEICVPHDFFQGNSGCVHTRYTGCGDIPEAGICVGETLLRYCDNDVVQERTCDQGWSCGLVAGADGDAGYFDCVPQQGVGPASPEDGEGAEVDPPEYLGAEDTVELEPRYGNKDNAAPSVEKGGAAAVGETAGGGGCGVGVGALPWTAVFALLAFRRRT